MRGAVENDSRRREFGRLSKVATVVLVAYACLFLGCAAVVIWYAGISGIRDNTVYLIEFVVALAAFTVSLILALSRESLRIGAALSAVLLTVGFVATDWHLGRPSVIQPRIAAMRELGIAFDERLPINVVTDARREGRTLLLQSLPQDFFGRPPAIDDEPIYPLTNPALSEVVLCKESGSFVTIVTDDLGFNNPLRTWDLAVGGSLVLIGDSYVEGWCVPPGKSFADRIRDVFPRTVNLGRAGFGPLLELATLREYAPYLKPRCIAWFFFENDFQNLRDEYSIPILRRYLDDPAFSQHLFLRRNEVNAAVAAYAKNAIVRLDSRKRLPFYGVRHSVNAMIPRLLALGGDQNDWQSKDRFAREAKIFAETLAQAKQAAAAEGAKLLLFYLRDFRPQPTIADDEALAQLRETILTTARRLGISLFDTADDVATLLGDPRKMHQLSTDYPVTRRGNIVRHYNALGHRTTAEAVVRHLGIEGC
jgi:hypothetical protein